jgi:glycosyltransferase involved in cell wall biosynthesis
MTDSPRVTVLVTCYNHAPYLPACLDSLRAQTFRNWEAVVIDDGSTDGSREWLAAACREGPWKLVFNERNLGTYGSLNVGLGLAQGELVALLNDDDLWAPRKLELQVAFMDAHPEAGLVHTDGGFIDGDGRPVPGSPLGFDFPRTGSGDVLLSLIRANKIIASAALFRAQCVREIGKFNEDYFGSGDWEMWFRIAEAWEIGFIDEPLTFYRVHGGNASHRLDLIWRDDQRLREWIAARVGSYAGRFPCRELQAAVSHNWACLGTVRTLNGDPAGGRSAFLASWRADRRRVKSLLRWAATFLPRPLFRRTV